MAEVLYDSMTVDSTAFNYYKDSRSCSLNQYQTLTLEKSKENEYAQLQLVSDSQQHQNDGTETVATEHENVKKSAKSSCFCYLIFLLILLISAVGCTALAIRILNTINRQPVGSLMDEIMGMKDMIETMQQEIKDIKQSLNLTTAHTVLMSQISSPVNLYQHCYKDILSCRMSLSQMNNTYWARCNTPFVEVNISVRKQVVYMYEVNHEGLCHTVHVIMVITWNIN